MTYIVKPIDNEGNCEIWYDYKDGKSEPTLAGKAFVRVSSIPGYVTLISSLFPTMRVPADWVATIDGLTKKF